LVLVSINWHCYFWSTSNEAELDLLLLKDGKRFGFEFKYTARPKLTKSMQIATQDLGLDSLVVIVPDDMKFTLADKIFVSGLNEFTLKE